MTIQRLLNKYYKPEGACLTADFKINPSEKHTKEYNKKMKREQYRKNRHLILQELLNEIPFRLNQNQVTQIKYWIDRFNDNFKDFHRRSSNETIILAFIMIQRKQANPRLEVERLSICKKYNLTYPVFINIQNKLIFQLMRTTELTYNQSKHLNHSILEKGEYK